MDIRVLLVALTACSVLVKGNFVLTVKFIKYTNPTGLCAECSRGLESVTSADQLTPVCCDESPFRSVNCDNTGEARCDTRFRWTIRPFGAPLEMRPVSVPMAVDPPYYFTRCDQSPTTCPFSEMSTTFSQGPTGFLGVAANPLTVVSTSLTTWLGRIQFFIEAIDGGLPNIIDSLLINLDNLQLGAGFTEEMMFTGYHNISHMTMSFRVACQDGFCGNDCTATPLNQQGVSECFTNGSINCINNRLDPSKGCNSCLQSSRNFSTDCTQCLPGWDISSGCMSCLPHRDPSTNCQQCLPNRDPSTDCSTCLFGWDNSSNCTSCLPGRDIDTSCTQCLQNRDLFTNCTQCSPGWDFSSDCMSCLPGRTFETDCQECQTNHDPSTDCSTCFFGWDFSSGCTICLQPGKDTNTNCTECLPNRDLSTNCTQCSPGWDIRSDCMTCLPHRDPSTNCTQCLPNRDPGTNCSTCLPGWDTDSDCRVCLTGRNLSTNCTTCNLGFFGEDCQQTGSTPMSPSGSSTPSSPSGTTSLSPSGSTPLSPSGTTPSSPSDEAALNIVYGIIPTLLVLLIATLVALLIVVLCCHKRGKHSPMSAESDSGIAELEKNGQPENGELERNGHSENGEAPATQTFNGEKKPVPVQNDAGSLEWSL